MTGPTRPSRPTPRPPAAIAALLAACVTLAGCSDTPTMPDEKVPPVVEPACGDGAINGDEACDGTELGGARCEAQGFAGGALACKPDCSGFDTSGCAPVEEPPHCGDGVREGAEVCDGADLNGQSCAGLGFASGELRCRGDCTGFDTRYCCGDGFRRAGEVCDGEDLGGETCEGLGFAGGELACAPDCASFDTSGCDPCGNGVVDQGETSETCCLDAGCPEGACDPAAMRCVDPWLLDCPAGAPAACSAQKPWYCPASGLPVYDCGRCGCPEGRVCRERFCYEPEVLAAERDQRMPPLNLPLDRYFELYDWAMSEPAFTLAELAERLDASLRSDARQVGLLLGESHNSEDEQAVGVQVIRDLLEAGWSVSELGIETHGSPILDPALIADTGVRTAEIEGDLTNDAYCAAARANVRNKLNRTSGVYLQYTGSGHTSREMAYHEANWFISRVPHTAECIAREGRKATTVVLFDPEVWLVLTDQVLLWRLGDAYPSEQAVGDALDETVARWRLTMGAQAREPQFDAQASGRAVNVRIVAARTPGVFFAYFPRPGRPAYFVEGFRALWQVSEIRALILANGIKPGNCSIAWDLTPGEEMLEFSCGNDALRIHAAVDGRSFEVLDWSAQR
ncbi:MAG: hypothetical protein ACOX6T_09405 [Myxococcales bacterium]|jgi:hypothetical protein